MFVVKHEKEIFLDLPNLKVFVPAPEYLFHKRRLQLSDVVVLNYIDCQPIKIYA